MADLVDHAFERWWVEHTEHLASNKVTAKAAWRASRDWIEQSLRGMQAQKDFVDAAVEEAFTPDPTEGEPGSDEPEKRDWKKISDEVRAATNLAMRNGLVIASVPGTNDKRVEAMRPGPRSVYVQVNGWSEMIHVLKDMEKRGAL